MKRDPIVLGHTASGMTVVSSALCEASSEDVAKEEKRLRHLLRQLFYSRVGLGQKVEELIAEHNHPLWHEVYEAVEEVESE